MTYNPNIPLGTDFPSQSRSQFLTNFGQLNTLFGADHFPFNYATVALRGRHQFVTLEQQAAGPATSGTQVALYSKAAAGATNLFMRRATSGTEVQLSSNADPIVATSGQTFLPGGLVMKWGQFTMSSHHTFVSYPVTGFPTNTLAVVVSPFLNNVSAYYVSTWSSGSFLIVGTTGDAFTYIAVGY